MENVGMVLVFVLAVAVIVLMFVCVRKEKKLSGFYKSIHVCGRWYAFFTGDLLLSGAGCVIALPILLVLMLMGKLDNVAAEMNGYGMLFTIIVAGAVIFLPIGLIMYRHALKKCPDNLKKGFLKDIIIIMFGTSCRLAFFFVAIIGVSTWWSYCRPTEYTINGRSAYTYGNGDDLYDEYGNHVGKLNGVDTAVMTDSRYQQ